MASGNGDLIYASEKLGLAVRIMATTHGTLQQRLLDGWLHEGHHAVPMGSGQAGIPMSDELVERIEAFNDRVSSRPAKAEEGTFTSTILAFDDDEATEAAKELIDINFQVEAELQDAYRRS